MGAGPGGLIAAEMLARASCAVTVFEHRRSPANKFLLAGRGGLNITNSEPLPAFLDRYGPERAWLEPAIRAWSPSDVQAWLSELGEPAFVGSSGRMFPASMRATPLLRAWLARLDELGVTLRTGHRWVDFAGASSIDGQLFRPTGSVETEQQVEHADGWLFALGGASWPRVGADGSWSAAFDRAGVSMVPIEPSNCGVRVEWKPIMLERFAGEPIKNVAVAAVSNTAPEQSSVRGDIVVTSDGLEGGPIYAHARSMRNQLRMHGHAVVAVDLQPDLTATAIGDRLAKRRGGATDTAWLRGAGVSPVKIALLRESTNNQLPSSATAMAELIKHCEVRVTALAGIDRAISTSGGVAQDAVTDDFMLRSRAGTFIAGEMLDWDAPTGGYLLQASLSTGVAAANGLLRWLAQAGKS